jgi:hypothetical protein
MSRPQLENCKLAHSPQVHFVTEPPDLAVLDHIKQHAVELLVMGTIARTGMPGLNAGNTERWQYGGKVIATDSMLGVGRKTNGFQDAHYSVEISMPSAGRPRWKRE